MVGGGPTEIPAVRRRPWPGKWLGMTTSSRGTDLWLGLGRKHQWRARPTEQGSGSCCEPSSGERAVRPGQCMGLEALVGPR
jgi:hypothetical protein